MGWKSVPQKAQKAQKNPNQKNSIWKKEKLTNIMIKLLLKMSLKN